jgi:hypothetical protein
MHEEFKKAQRQNETMMVETAKLTDPVDGNFSCQVENAIKCNACGKVTLKRDEYRDFSIFLPEVPDLYND